MHIRMAFAGLYIPFVIFLGELIHSQGKKILQHAFGDVSAISSAITILLRIGWYLTSFGLLLWNLGVRESQSEIESSDLLTLVAFRLGIALFLLGVLHGASLLSVSLFHRKNSI
ncbi:MAG: hypothetical protein U0V70_07865 [Terriglobia bacterium]